MPPERLLAELDPLPADRREPVARMLAEEVGTCPRCNQPVHRSDPRKLDGDQLAHLRCIEEGE